MVPSPKGGGVEQANDGPLFCASEKWVAPTGSGILRTTLSDASGPRLITVTSTDTKESGSDCAGASAVTVRSATGVCP
jgi:hypothetical protein